MTHAHDNDCEHLNIRHCVKCDVAYCMRCKKEWREPHIPENAFRVDKITEFPATTVSTWHDGAQRPYDLYPTNGGE